MSIKILLLNYNLAFKLFIVIFIIMQKHYGKYYYYSHLDILKESLGVCVSSDIGEATNHFAAIKNMPVNEFLKIYSIGLKNEHK